MYPPGSLIAAKDMTTIKCWSCNKKGQVSAYMHSVTRWVMGVPPSDRSFSAQGKSTTALQLPSFAVLSGMPPRESFTTRRNGWGFSYMCQSADICEANKLGMPQCFSQHALF